MIFIVSLDSEFSINRIIRGNDYNFDNRLQELQRHCLHSSRNELQCMIIYMPPDFKYDFIKDDQEGEISFYIIKNRLILKFCLTT